MSGFTTVTVQSPVATQVRTQRSRVAKSRARGSEPYHAELLAALTLQISRGRPQEAMTLIEGLLSSARQRGHAKFIAELTTLRAVAELQAQAQGMAPGSTNGAPTRQPDVVSTMMEFTQRIMPSVEMAARQGSNPVLTAQLIAELFNGKLPEREPCLEVPEMLSVREFQVLQLVAQGHSNQQVGHQLCISEGTVKKHLSNLLDKLNAGNRTQAVARARAIGIL